MNITYIITGDIEEIAKVAESVREYSRFLSDKANISAYKWYPITPETQVLEVDLGEEVAQAELEILTKDLTSLTIGRLYDGILRDVISYGETEVVDDETNATR